ncbi:protein usf [Panicum miliaceum]|uniref:Protein usf n=1 Tax=Panicum miliaceum TaxID=4540 RepID=A0A3L6SNX8_PANMI|nr:protein usf [Panicum miliaceum]
MATAHLLRRASSAFLSSTTTGPLRSRCSLPRLRLPRAAMATDSSAAPFQKIQIQREDTTFDAYVVGKENAPGIVVLQEWWGVDYEIKNHAIHISQLGGGYRALIPDLYRGKVALDVAEAQHLMDGLDWQGAVKDIQASVKWLKSNGSPKAYKHLCCGVVLYINMFTYVLLKTMQAGVTGYCMGGALSIASGVLVPEVDAVVAFYGTPSSELADPSKAKAPIQAHFGEHDSFVGFSDVTFALTIIFTKTLPRFFLIYKAAKSLEEKLKSSGVPYEVHIYPGCSHAFMNTSPEALKRKKGMGLTDENQEAVDLAWSRFSAWMGRFLGSA